ncbi:glycoside hydrolase family 79 protein [Rhizodiscina lignyota]|uniref:Glycoside hydrolase family 79 protein n=1 Tax=Rhizodiscina lignyota TaxID=1504668 RepID=A0A9P4IFB0_9PEZI|nr:glycoside hydrolase family 79 protein [Rhizodiscina lignyota]
MFFRSPLLSTSLLTLPALIYSQSTLTPSLQSYNKPAPANGYYIDVADTAKGVAAPLPEGFVAYSIEFAYFPDFAGNRSEPNTFSDNLLNNLRDIQGTKPYIRVGGNTQDYALYNASLKTATFGIVVPSRSPDYPYILYIGPSYFESYETWPGTRFSHGFNLGKNGTVGRQTLLATAPLACKALGRDKLYYWELGNEPDLYKTSAQGVVRPANWTEEDYIAEWKSGTNAAESVFRRVCPELTGYSRNRWLAPSFAGTSNSLNDVTTWKDGLDSAHNIALDSIHNYIGGATQPGVTLQGTLMNHTKTTSSVDNLIALRNNLSYTGVPFILGETNSLYNEGAPGLSNSFGAALWGVDFNLYCASQGIRRVHMHQGTDYRYASWQPVDTNKTTKGTKAPYYGNIAVANMLGDLTKSEVQIKNLLLKKEREAAYAAYVNGKLKRVLVINMVAYNYSVPDPGKRPTSTYSFKLPESCSGIGVANYLQANGSDAITGITWNGISYNYELDSGKPKLLGNVTKNTPLYISGGVLNVELRDSEAAMVNLKC